MLEIAKRVFQPKLPEPSANAYLLFDGAHAIAIDPGLQGKEAWQKELATLGLGFEMVELVLLTHSHYDHAYNARLFPKATVRASKNCIEKLEGKSPKTFFEIAGLEYSDSGKREAITDGEKISLGAFEFECIETIGHSNCSACFFEKNSSVFFSGDTIFPEGSLPRIFDSTERSLRASYAKIGKKASAWKPKLLAPGHGKASSFEGQFALARQSLAAD